MGPSGRGAWASRRSYRRRPPSPTPSRTPPACGLPSCRSRPSGSLWRSRAGSERLALEGTLEVALGAGFDAVAELPVARQELAAGGGQAHPGCGTAAGHPLEELEAGGTLELLQVAPRVPVRHPEIRRG